MRVTFLLVAMALAAPLSAEEFFIPSAMQGEGSDGAWWNTEVWFANTGTTPAGYAVVFLPGDRPANIDEIESQPVLEDIPPRATVYRNDVVPAGSFGALRILTTPGVAVHARVFNAAGRGSSGHALPALPRGEAIRPGQTAHLLGLHRTPQFRANVGLINPTDKECSVQLLLITRRGEEVSSQEYRLPPGAVLVLNEALHAFGVKRGEHMRLELTGTGSFFAYSQTVDARSGAATLGLPQY